jgi:hypothetical protein
MLDVIKLHSGDTEIILESKLTFFVKFEFTFFHICAVDKYGQIWTIMDTFVHFYNKNHLKCDKTSFW